MLKFQNNYTTLFATFEDFILLVYTVIDDLYQQFAPACVSQRRNADSARMSDSEIITLSICDERLWEDMGGERHLPDVPEAIQPQE